jgi:2-keto-3-deoxy-L-rhamnonate aldolase RhmA
MNELERIKSKLKAGEPVIGTSVNLGDSCITELLGSIGYDFIWIDMEHTGNDKMDILHHIIAAKAAGTASFVRIPWNDPVLAKPILDMGPDGMIFPFIRSVEEARQAINSCIYPPNGQRGFNPIRAVRYGLDDVSEYINDVENRIFKMIQIEHIGAVDCLEEIIEIEGIDALIVGPMDLSGSLGKLGKIRDKEVLKVMDKIGEIAIKSKIPLGLAIGYSPVDIKEWIDRGIKIISVNGDTGFLTDAGKETLKQTKRLFGI